MCTIQQRRWLAPTLPKKTAKPTTVERTISLAASFQVANDDHNREAIASLNFSKNCSKGYKQLYMVISHK